MAGGDRSCANCGAPVGVLVDVCPGCGADPDLRLLELGAGGGRRRGDRPVAPRRAALGWKRWVPIVAAVVAVWGFLAVTAGDGDDDEQEATEAPEPTTSTTADRRQDRTDTTRRPRPTTTTTTPLTDRAPLLGGETGYVLMANTGRARLIDLDTGASVRLPPTANVLGAADGRLLVSRNQRMAWWPPPFDGTDAEPIPVGNGSDAWIDAETRVVWFGVSDGSGWTTVQSMDLDGDELAAQQLPLGSYPAGVLDGELIVSAPGGTFAVSPGGGSEQLSTGQAMSVGEGRIVVARCEAELECAYEVLDRSGAVLDRFDYGMPVLAYGPYGQIVAISSRGQVAQVTVDDRGDPTITIDGLAVDWAVSRSGIANAAWSPDGRWLFVGDGQGDIVVVDGERRSVVTTLESEDLEPVWRVLVLDGLSLQP